VQTVKVSTVQEVLEQFRQDVVAGLRSSGFKPPPEAEIPGNHYEAVTAWVRLQHRSVAKTPRSVSVSAELQLRNLETPIQSALGEIRTEFERGKDLTPRLTRQFYKAAFNDFLFNVFGIQHIHLGPPGAARDKTKLHVMSGGADALLFVMIEPSAVYFLDVLDHDVFDSPEMSKSLVRIAIKNWPALLDPYTVPGVTDVKPSFEGAFSLQKAGFVTLFELDGKVFMRGGNVLDGKVNNGKRATCTSTQVVRVARRILNGIVSLVEYIEREAIALAELMESRIGRKPTELKLVVVQVGNVTVLRDENTAIKFVRNGSTFGLLEDTNRSNGQLNGPS
jgi:hypothetical protein